MVGWWRTRIPTRFFAWPKGEESPRDRKRTWAEKITDNENAWLHARRLELEGDFRGAADAYARDKEIERDRSHDARAALSAASEARCLERVGLDGSSAALAAGRLYFSAAWLELRADPRAAMRLFERARECYELSNSVSASLEVASLTEAIRVALDISEAYRGPARGSSSSLVSQALP